MAEIAAEKPPMLRMATPMVGERELAYVTDAVSSGWISSVGSYVAQFEERFAAFSGARHGVAVSNGSVALHLAMAALGIGPGDEVIIPPVTHVAVANAVTLVGATPVLADCSLETWGLDPARVAEKITPRTRAIVPVHLYGHPVEMQPLIELAQQHGIFVVEDAAEAHGAEAHGRRAGSLGHLACFSFYANKIVTTGEGGMILTSDDELAARTRSLRDQAYGKGAQRFMHQELGFNYRFTNVQAAIGCAQMERADEFVETHRRNARLLNDLLADVPGLTLPPEQPWARNVYWMYTVLVDAQRYGMSRDRLMEVLKDEYAIDSRAVFHPMHRQPLYEQQFAGQSYPVSERLASEGLNLPSGNELGEADVRRIAAALKGAAQLAAS